MKALSVVTANLNQYLRRSRRDIRMEAYFWKENYTTIDGRQSFSVILPAQKIGFAVVGLCLFEMNNVSKG